MKPYVCYTCDMTYVPRTKQFVLHLDMLNIDGSRRKQQWSHHNPAVLLRMAAAASEHWLGSEGYEPITAPLAQAADELTQLPLPGIS